MTDHIKIIFPELLREQIDILVAHLSEIGYTGFEEGHTYLLAYIGESDFNKTELDQLANDFALSYQQEKVEAVNWNEAWEKSFQPVVVDDFCAIRASFHPAIKGVEHDIIITPKMSFGTGHHATTYMVVQWMKTIRHEQKTVLDFGTGTGVLAILAEKLGAKEITAIDNDDWSIDNAKENIVYNNCTRIFLNKADTLDFKARFDIILANINKNVLLANMPLIQQHLEKEGVLVLSGLLEGDRPAIEASANSHKLKITGELNKNGWIALQATHY